MLRRVFFLLLFLCALPTWAQPTKAVKTRLFEATVPSDWEERLTDAALYLLYPGKDAEDPQYAHISVTPSKLSGSMSFDMFTFMAKSSIESNFPELQLSYSRPTKLGKVDGHRFEYKGVRQGKKYQIVQVMAVSGSNGYTIEFRGSEADFNSLHNGFDQMLRTFKTP